MKRIVLSFGLILGAILAGHMVYMVNQLYTNPDIQPNDIIGYAAMIIVFSLSFFGIRNYRDKQLNGFISFGKAFKTGTWIVFLGSTVYVVTWLFYYYLFVPDFMDLYTSHVLSTTPQEELEEVKTSMAQMNSLYENPLFVVFITYLEVFPIGLVVALVSALILKKNPPAAN